MSELDIARLLNDKVVDFGNERFLEGWNGQKDYVIKLIQVEISRVSNPMLVDREYLDGLEKALELIKGENKPFITAKQAEELTNEMLEE